MCVCVFVCEAERERIEDNGDDFKRRRQKKRLRRQPNGNFLRLNGSFMRGEKKGRETA